MERNCKNCNELIYAGKSHCANCGSKWIDNRITLRQVAADFSDNYIGVDTKFVRTFVDLFRRPESVILGYMNGRRVNYMDAVRYLLLALFVTGVYTFVLTKTGVLDGIIQGQLEATLETYRMMGIASDEVNSMATSVSRYTKLVFEFQGFILLLTIPLLALIARITFWNKRYFNFTEQIVFYLYTYGHSVIVTTPFTIFLVFIVPEAFTYIGFVSLPLMYFYNAYCYKRCFGLDTKTAIMKLLLSLVVAVLMVIAVGILMFILGMIVAIILKALGLI